MKLVGLDVGTTTICGVVLDAIDGRIVFLETQNNPAGIPGNAPWESLQHPDAAVQTARSVLDKALEAHRDIGGIGVAGQMHGVLYVDGAGNAVSPLYTWQDGRGDLPFEEGTYASFVSSALGSPVSSGLGIVTHFVNTRKGLVPRPAVALCTIGDYLVMKLTGRRAAMMETTIAASLGGFDLKNLSFDRRALQAIGLDPTFLPEVTSSYPTLGEIGPSVPVFPAIGDNQASFLGSVSDAAHMALVNVGTGSQVSLFIPAFRRIQGIDVRPLPFGGYIGVGAGLCGGRAYAALREFFQRTARLVTGRDTQIAWEDLNAMIPPHGEDPLKVDTRFCGTRLSPDIRGSVRNIGLSNLTPEHLASGVREGIMSELLGFYDLFDPAERKRIDKLVGSGNAIRLNKTLRQAFERGFRLPLLVPSYREEASFGAALLAGVASGIIPDRSAAGALVRYTDPQSAAI
jgi:sedoheptulokinase